MIQSRRTVLTTVAGLAAAALAAPVLAGDKRRLLQATPESRVVWRSSASRFAGMS
jgi:hypothetical protein